MSALRRYTVAALLTVLALAVGLIGGGAWGPSVSYSLFLGAVMLSSWVSGLGPGLVSTVVGTIAADYFLIPPIHHLTFDASRLVQLSVFVVIAALISSLNDARRRALHSLSAERARLEHRVTARTAELARANDELREEIERRSRSERNFRGLIDAAPDGIVVIDGSGLIVKVNAEAERMFGYRREALVGRDVEMIIPERFRKAHHDARERYAAAPSARTIVGAVAARRADGTEVPVDIRISPLETGGQFTVVGIVRDVTERQRAHEEQQRLVHALGERVKELTALHAVGRLLNEPGQPADLLPQIVQLLPAAWQYPEIASARIDAAQVDARTDGFAVTPWIQRATFSIPGGNHGSIEVVYREPRPDAAEGPFLAEERTLIESLAAMLRAYFERLQVERQRVDLARAEAGRQRAQEDNAAKDQFLATLSHELRAPLNVMLGWTRMLRAGQMAPESAARGFEVLERSVQLQSKLIEDLLDVSRIIAGKLPIEKQYVDLAVIAHNVVDAARPAARAKNVELTAAITPSLMTEADPHRLQQAISNLLTNALKFTPERGSVDVSVERIDDQARITVRDTGVGIPHELLPRIFDRFQQGDSSTTRGHGGLGLGLAIVKHLVEQHSGRIAVSSEGANRGSTFTITLPLSPADVLAQAPSAYPTADESLLAGVRVLVVDDEADTRATLNALLEQFGAHPTVVASATEALDVVRQAPPDVLLSDIAMPGEDGYTLIRRIRTTIDATRLPAAALSAYVDGNNRARAVDAGFQEYLTKPIDPASLARALARLIGGNCASDCVQMGEGRK